MAYPCFSKPCEIYTDASTLQLGAVITQDIDRLCFFSQTITELDLLAKGVQWNAVGGNG